MTLKEPVLHEHYWICALDHNICAYCGVKEGEIAKKTSENPVSAGIRARIFEIQAEKGQI